MIQLRPISQSVLEGVDKGLVDIREAVSHFILELTKLEDPSLAGELLLLLPASLQSAILNELHEQNRSGFSQRPLFLGPGLSEEAFTRYSAALRKLFPVLTEKKQVI